MTRIAFFIFLFATTCAFGQTSESQIGVFYSLPTGNFASTDYANDGGYAQPGWGIVFDSWRTPANWGNFGFFTHSTYQWNKLDAEQLAKDYSDALNLKVTATDSRYSPFVTTIGPSYTFSFGNGFQLGIGIAPGIMFNSTKGLTLDLYDNQGAHLETYQVNFDNNVAFAYYGVVQVNYTVVEDLFKVGLFADYTGATQKTELRVAGVTTDSSQDISFMNFGFKFIIISPK